MRSQNCGNISAVCAVGNGPKPLSLNTSTLLVQWPSLWFMPKKHHLRTAEEQACAQWYHRYPQTWTTSNLHKFCHPEQQQGQEKCDAAMQQEMTGDCWWLEGGLSAGERSLTGLTSEQLGAFSRHQKVSCLPNQTKRKFGFLKVWFYLCVFNTWDGREGNLSLRILVS